jgi:YYY domain-containing protein
MSKQHAHYLFWLLLLPPAFYGFWTLQADVWHLFAWWLALSLPGWLIWPWAVQLLPGGDHGYLMAKGLGLVIPAFIVWTLSFCHILPFARWAIVLVLLALGALAWFRNKAWRQIGDLVRSPEMSPRLACSEALFFGALVFWTYARGLKPELDSLEKFMNIGFMNSLWRTTWLPAPDMWFAGGTINYYYFGQYAYTYLARLTNIRPEIAYNLGMATTFALTAALAYTAGSRLIALLRRSEKGLSGVWSTACGLIAAGWVTVAGNGHAFFYSESGPGNFILRRALASGLINGTADGPYWFADATRYIGYNPETADKTIHEFPYYSFLVADLHAHVINLAFVLVLIILMTELIGRSRLLKAAADCRATQQQLISSDDNFWHRTELAAVISRWKTAAGDSLLWLVALLLAVFMMGNYWDFAIYFAVTAIVLLLLNFRGYGSHLKPSSFITVVLQGGLLLIPWLWLSHPLAALFGFAVVLVINHYLTLICGDALTLTGAQVSWLFFLSHALSLPFNLSFEPIAKSIARTQATTPFWQLLVLWGPHVAAGLVLLVTLLVLHKKPRIRSFPPPAGHALARHGLNRFFLPVNLADSLAVGLFIWAVCLILLPELVYVVDIYSGDYKRANTMFKFTYQAFVLLTLVWAYAIVRIASLQRRSTIRLAAFVLVMLLAVPAWYPAIATRQWLGEFTRERYQGLDGLALLAKKDSPQVPGQSGGELSADVAAIRWFNEHVDGHPVILETYGESYTDYCRISAFTGLPTVMGWETHEWLWRTSKETPSAYSAHVLPRQNDVTTLYTTEDQELRRSLAAQYQIKYIIIGDMERARFSVDRNEQNSPSLLQEELLLELGPVVFSDGTLLVIQVSD